MIPYALLSWFRIQPGTTLARVQYFLYRVVDPVSTLMLWRWAKRARVERMVVPLDRVAP